MKRILLLNLALRMLLACIGLSMQTPLLAALTSQDDADLTSCFEQLSEDWDQPSVDQANAILSRSEYSATDWNAWFTSYFNTTDHPYTDDLQNFLRYPVFDWLGVTVNLKLQLGLIDSMWNKAAGIVSANQLSLGVHLSQNPDSRQSLFNAHRFFTWISKDGIIDETARQGIYQRYKDHITAFPQFYSDITTINAYDEPLIALLRAQVWAVFGDILELTEERKAEIAQIIQLEGPDSKKQAIWDSFGVMVMDNNQLSIDQLIAIEALLGAIPKEMSNLRFITVRDFMQAPKWHLPIILKGQTGGSINYYFELSDFRATNSFDGAAGSWPGPSAVNPIQFDSWNHIATTYDGAAMRVYLNGSENNSFLTTGNPVSTSQEPLHIGYMPDFNHWMRGILDEVKIYSRVLTPDEIRDTYQMEAVSATGLIAYWNMDETSGTNVADVSGLGHHGQNANAQIVTGKVNNGLYFNGENAQVTVPDHPDLRLSEQITLEAWVFIANEWPMIFPGVSEMVNNFGCGIQEVVENSFPDDIEPRMVSTFCIGNCHEYNHVVDAYTVRQNPVLQARLMQLISQAGDEPMQYLRSMGINPDGTSSFPEAPQEFFASISNEYFTDSWHTLDLALLRFSNGYHEPINQFLFFADVYSQGTLTTKVYTMDTGCNLTVTDAPLERNEQGCIIRITRSDTKYHFTLDENGNVTTWHSETEICPPADISGDCFVNLNDLLYIAEQWLQSPGNPSADIAPSPAGDGIVNLEDFAIFARHWLEGASL